MNNLVPDPRPAFLDETVRVLLALRPKPSFVSEFDERAWFDALYWDAEKLWAARERRGY
jgi:hypothetical protein